MRERLLGGGERVVGISDVVIQGVATGKTTAFGTVEVDVYGTVEQCTCK